MTDDASPEAAGTIAGGSIPPIPSFEIRRVPPPTAAERQRRRDAMARAIQFGAVPYRDAEGKARHVSFKEANIAPVEAWRRDPEARRGFRRVQQARQATGQLIGHPEDQVELAKRLGVMHYREGRSAEGAAERGLFDAIWRHEHVFDSFTVPRHYGIDRIETGRIAAVAEDEARRLQAEDPAAQGGFWVRDRRNNGLIYVVPQADPEAAFGAMIAGGEGDETLIGQAASSASGSGATSPQAPAIPPRMDRLPASADDLFGHYRQRLAPREGGLANRSASADPGGLTNKGLSQKALDGFRRMPEYQHYPATSDLLTDDQIDTLFRKEYFDPLHIWQVAQIPDLLKSAPELPEQLFDIAVQHGPGDAGLFLQEALNEVMGVDLRIVKNGTLAYDGVIGPATRKAISDAVAAGKIVEVNDLIVAKRLVKMKGLGNFNSNRGWLSRAEAFRIAPVVP